MASEELFYTVVRSTKYPVDAFMFVHRGLDFTVRRIHGELQKEKTPPQIRHVDGRALCLGLRDYAIDQYGLLARTVLRRWHIHSCKDFGQIVFAMVDADLMKKTETDSMRDFIDVFDFNEAFAPALELSENP